MSDIQNSAEETPPAPGTYERTTVESVALYVCWVAAFGILVWGCVSCQQLAHQHTERMEMIHAAEKAEGLGK